MPPLPRPAAIRCIRPAPSPAPTGPAAGLARRLVVLAAMLLLVAPALPAAAGFAPPGPRCVPAQGVDLASTDVRAASAPKRVAVDDRAVEVGAFAARVEAAPAHYALVLSCPSAGDPSVSFELEGSGPASGGVEVDPPEVRAEPGLPDAPARPREGPR